jgi:hypothetical protein
MAELNIQLLPRQKEIMSDPTRFKIICAGRRFGKSRYASYAVIIKALSLPDGVFWLVSPSYSQTKIIWRMIKRFLPKSMIERTMEGELYLQLKNGATIWAKSGDNVDSLRGEGLDGCVIDEYAFVKAEVWNEAIRPALSDKKGWCIFIGTPSGKNHFYELFLRGLDTNQSEYKSYQYPSWDNPLMDPHEIEEMRKTMPEITFRQEVMAEFVDSGGLVFRGLDKVLGSIPEAPKPGEFYVLGVDLGRHEDFTVIKVGKISEMREVYRERFNRSDWSYIKDRIRSVYNLYNKGYVIMDSTGVGDPVFEELAKEGIHINGINLNVKTKPELIENLQLMIENRAVQFIDDDNFKLEMGAFTYTMLPSGNVRYEGSSGFHDDEVISTSLMAFGLMGGSTSAFGVVAPEPEKDELEVDYDEIEDVIDTWDDLEEYEKRKD